MPEIFRRRGKSQAAAAIKASGNPGMEQAASRWVSSINCAAISPQQPQVVEQPVATESSASVRAPSRAASRMARSVTPLQMQTYMLALGAW